MLYLDFIEHDVFVSCGTHGGKNFFFDLQVNKKCKVNLFGQCIIFGRAICLRCLFKILEQLAELFMLIGQRANRHLAYQC